MVEQKKKRKRRVTNEIARSQEKIRAFISDIGAALSKAGGRFLKNLDGNKRKDVAALLGQFDQAIRETVLEKAYERVEDIYSDELAIVRKDFEANSRKIAFSGADKQTVKALFEAEFSVVENLFADYIGDLRRGVMSQVLLGQDPDFQALEEELGSRLASHLETELNTGVAAFQRTVATQKANDLGLKKFLYEGPDDDVIRPFCEERVGRVFTDEEAKDWDNGQGLPADIFLGGYNCRHRKIYLDDEDAEQFEEEEES